VARVALQDQPDAARKLRLDGHSGRRATWLAQARQFYANALADPALLSGLAAFGVTQASLEDGAREVEAMAARYAARQQRKGDAQDTTRTRDEALAALARWMHNFAAIARMALKDRPQQLEKLGLALRATPRPAARQRQVV